MFVCVMGLSTMLFKESWVYVSDNTNIRWIKVFQLYKGSRRRQTGVGMFIKGSARVVEPPRIVYKGFRYKYKVRGDICRGLVARANRLHTSGVASHK